MCDRVPYESMLRELEEYVVDVSDEEQAEEEDEEGEAEEKEENEQGLRGSGRRKKSR